MLFGTIFPSQRLLWTFSRMASLFSLLPLLSAFFSRFCSFHRSHFAFVTSQFVSGHPFCFQSPRTCASPFLCPHHPCVTILVQPRLQAAVAVAELFAAAAVAVTVGAALLSCSPPLVLVFVIFVFFSNSSFFLRSLDWDGDASGN